MSGFVVDDILVTGTRPKAGGRRSRRDGIAIKRLDLFRCSQAGSEIS